MSELPRGQDALLQLLAQGTRSTPRDEDRALGELRALARAS